MIILITKNFSYENFKNAFNTRIYRVLEHEQIPYTLFLKQNIYFHTYVCTASRYTQPRARVTNIVGPHLRHTRDYTEREGVSRSLGRGS